MGPREASRDTDRLFAQGVSLVLLANSVHEHLEGDEVIHIIAGLQRLQQPQQRLGSVVGEHLPRGGGIRVWLRMRHMCVRF